MKNPEEHKKLLAQITELEKNSVNYFDVEKEFFLIDSNNLAEIKTKLYGYTIQATGIYENDDLTEDAAKNLDGRGCYVYVEARDGKITIKQDLNGCWGIYLFRHGDYFALSNSFFRLLDHVKFKYPLTVNRDYCHYLMMDFVAVQSYSATAVNEVQIIDRSTVIHIDVKKKTLELEMIDYKEHSVPLDSAEGVAIMDRWVEFWGNVLRGIAQHTKFIIADLTGGFDTRINFVPLLHSGIDLNKIRINSIKNDLNPTLKEDYIIATEIAEHYDFKLNQQLPARPAFNYSLKDIWHTNVHCKQTFSNLASFARGQAVDKVYHYSGNSSEVFRKTWHMPPQQFIDRECSRSKRYSRSLSQELTHSVQNIIESVFRSVRDKYHIADPNSVDIPQYLYHDTRSRIHCGKAATIGYLRNALSIVPAYDREMQTLQLKTSKCPDYNLLMVLLFTRYAPDLLKIRFDKFHEPPDLENLIPYAKEINERFPICHKKAENLNGGGGQNFHLQPRDLQAEKILAEGKTNPNFPGNLPETYLKAMFDSSRTYGLFTTYFDAELYDFVANYYETQIIYPNRPVYAIVAITRALEDVEISQRNHTPYQDMKRFLEQDFVQIHDDDNAEIVNKFKNYFTARVDIKLATTEGDFQIVDVSDDKANVSKPGWFNKDGVGYVIQSYAGNLEFVAKASVDGKVSLSLRGIDVRDPDDKSKFIPYWIDYTKLTINGKVIFDTLTPAWHNKAYRHNMDAKAGDEIKIQIEWLPHRSDT